MFEPYEGSDKLHEIQESSSQFLIVGENALKSIGSLDEAFDDVSVALEESFIVPRLLAIAARQDDHLEQIILAQFAALGWPAINGPGVSLEPVWRGPLN